MSETKKLFFVVGPESSGTKLVTKLLIQHGCLGDAEDAQRLDDAVGADDVTIIEKVTRLRDNIVLRRSFPHRRVWPDIMKTLEPFLSVGYDPLLIVVRRNWPCTALSQVSCGHVPDAEAALKRIRLAEKSMAEQAEAAGLLPLVVDYDFLVSHPRACIVWLARACGLEPKVKFFKEVELYNNKKRLASILAGDAN